MKFDIEYTDEFGIWWNTLSETEQEDIVAVVDLLEEKGPQLPFPFSTGNCGVKTSSYARTPDSKQVRSFTNLICF